MGFDNTAPCSPNGTTAAFAGACIRDQFGRPIAGVVNFCPNKTATSLDIDWITAFSVTIHELTHALVFSSPLFGHFVDSDRKLSLYSFPSSQYLRVHSTEKKRSPLCFVLSIEIHFRHTAHNTG